MSGSSLPAEIPAREHGPGPTEEQACLGPDAEGADCCQAVVSTQSLSFCDRSEEGGSPAVGSPALVGSVNQAEETDRGEAAIEEGQEVKGKEAPDQETEDRTVRRKEEEEEEDQKTLNGDEKASVMGQTPSSEGSDGSDSEVNEAETCGKGGTEPCDGLSSDNAGKEELTEPLSAPEGLRSPSLINHGDVIKGPESPAPRLLIEGLHEGEPPPDINSLEQNQETAVGDYATEPRWGSAPETPSHSGNCAGEVLHGQDVGEPSGGSVERCSSSRPGSSMEDVRTALSLERTLTSGNADPDCGTARCLSSDDDCSFRSVGSSTTLDSAGVEDQDSLETRMVEPSSEGRNVEEMNDSQPAGDNERSAAVEQPGSHGSGTVKDCSPAGTEPDSQLSPRPSHTMEALSSEGTGEQLTPDLCKEDPALSESGSPTMVKVRESETGESGSSGLNTGIHLSSDSTGAAETDQLQSESSDGSASDSAGEGEDVGQDGSEMKEDQRSLDVSPSCALTPPEELNRASSEPSIEEEMTEETLDTDGQSAVQGGEKTLISFIFFMVPHTH